MTPFFLHRVEDERAAKLCRFALQPIGTQSVRMFVLSEPAEEAFGLWPAQHERMMHVFDYAFRAAKVVGTEKGSFWFI
jgi:23S rRNA U2552 (ribose-2'-O)-methylase RlmE/FtsJ